MKSSMTAFGLLPARTARGCGSTAGRNDLTRQFPLIAEALARLRSRSCILDGEAVACDDNGLAVFELLRRKPEARHVLLFAFDLLELGGQDLRREPFEVRKAMLASLLRGCLPGLHLNERLVHPGDVVFRHACTWGSRASSRSGSARAIALAGRTTGSSPRTWLRRR